MAVAATTTRFFASCFLQRGGESAREKFVWQQQPILEGLLLAQRVSRFGISDKEKLAVAKDDKNNTTTAITGRR